MMPILNFIDKYLFFVKLIMSIKLYLDIESILIEIKLQKGPQSIFFCKLSEALLTPNIRIHKSCYLNIIIF